jgi:hypothetical protein
LKKAAPPPTSVARSHTSTPLRADLALGRHDIDEERLPPGRVVVEFDFTSPESQLVWMVLDRGEASVCIQPPGFDPDVIVTTTTPALADVFQGYTTWADAVAAIHAVGSPALVKSLPRWFRWSPFADLTRARASRSVPPT